MAGGKRTTMFRFVRTAVEWILINIAIQMHIHINKFNLSFMVLGEIDFHEISFHY